MCGRGEGREGREGGSSARRVAALEGWVRTPPRRCSLPWPFSEQRRNGKEAGQPSQRVAGGGSSGKTVSGEVKTMLFLFLVRGGGHLRRGRRTQRANAWAATHGAQSDQTMGRYDGERGREAKGRGSGGDAPHRKTQKKAEEGRQTHRQHSSVSFLPLLYSLQRAQTTIIVGRGA